MPQTEDVGVLVLGAVPLIVTLPLELKDKRAEVLRVGLAEEERDALGEDVAHIEAVDVRDELVDPLYVVELLADLLLEAEIVSDAVLVCTALLLIVAVEHGERAEVLLSLSVTLIVFFSAPLALCEGELDTLLVSRVVGVLRERPVYVALDDTLADAVFVAVGVFEEEIDREPVGQLVLVFEPCMLRVSLLVPNRTVPVAKGVVVLVLEALADALCVIFALAVFDGRVDAETLEEPVDVFDAEIVPVVVRLIAGVDVARVVLLIVALPEEVREGLAENVCEPLVVELLLLLAERLCDGLLLLVFVVVTEPVVVFVTRGVRVLRELGDVLFVNGVDRLPRTEVEEVLEDVIL